MPLTLKSLTLRGFGPFVEEQRVELPASGMYLVRGENADTGGSSGSGKSRLIEALAFALDYSTFNATDLQSWSWLSSTPMSVCLDFSNRRGERVRVRRGKPTSVQVGEGPVQTSARTTLEVLRAQLGGLSSDMLKALTYRPQRAPGLFLSMRDLEKKAFLTELLDLGRYEDLAKASVKSITDLERQADQLKAVADRLKSMVPPTPVPPETGALASSLAQAVERVASLAARVKSIHGDYDAEVARRVKIVGEVKEHWRKLVAGAESSLAGVRRPDVSELEEARLKILAEQAGARRAHASEAAELAERHNQLKSLLAAKLTLASSVSSTEAELARVDAALGVLASKTCYTCKRPWPDAAQDPALLERRAQLLKTISGGEEAKAEVPSVELEVAGAAREYGRVAAEDPVSQELKDAERQLTEAVATADSAYRAQVSEARASVERVRREAATAEMEANTQSDEEARLLDELGKTNDELGEWRSAEVRLRGQVDSARREYELASSHHEASARAAADAQDKLDATDRKLGRERDFLGYVRGFLSLIFDETLARVAYLTNQRLAQIPNVAGVTLRFESERETDSNTVRQEIRAVAEKDGYAIPLKAGVSGGMYTAVELAVDLSLADVISERTGVVPGWLILDESFEGLDTVCKSACFDLLKAASSDRAVFVVDHTSEFVEKFNRVITVRHSGGRSVVL